jgi:hypothetical protein
MSDLKEECPIAKARRQLASLDNLTEKQATLNRPLYKAISERNLEAIDAAIESGADVNAIGCTSRERRSWFVTSLSPLEEVIYGRHNHNCFLQIIDFEIAEKLIIAGAKYDIGAMIIKEGESFSSDEWISYLLNKTQDFSGLLHIAARNNRSSITSLLIKKGADVNEISLGNSPLHVAVQYERFEIVEELLQAGASLDKKNKDNLTAYDIAIKNNYLKLAAFLTRGWQYSLHYGSAHCTQIDISNQLFRLANLMEIYLYASVLQDEEEDEEEYE